MERNRAPHGVVTNKPIGMRLLPEELTDFKEMCVKENRPMANMARLIVVRSLEHYKRTGKLPL